MLFKAKPMKLLIASLLFLTACSSSNPTTPVDGGKVAKMGTVDGGGGKGVKCYGQVRTLDLYEAEEIRNLPVVRSGASFDSVLWDRAFSLMAHISDDDVAKYKTDPSAKTQFDKEFNQGIIGRFNFITPGTRLDLTKDAHVPSLKTGCEEIQIAVYAKDDKIYVDQEYWSALTSDDQVALVLHEWLYRRARTYGALDSDETREVIGDIFAKQDPLPMFEPIWGRTDLLFCIGGGGSSSGPQPIFEFYAANETVAGVSGVQLYFRGLSSVYLMNRATSFLPNMTTDQLHEDSIGQWSMSSTVWEHSHPAQTIEIYTQPDICKSQIVGNMLKLRTFDQSSAKPVYSNVRCIRRDQSGQGSSRVCRN